MGRTAGWFASTASRNLMTSPRKRSSLRDSLTSRSSYGVGPGRLPVLRVRRRASPEIPWICRQTGFNSSRGIGGGFDRVRPDALSSARFVGADEASTRTADASPTRVFLRGDCSQLMGGGSEWAGNGRFRPIADITRAGGTHHRFATVPPKISFDWKVARVPWERTVQKTIA